MKKFVAILLATMFVLSSSVMAFAAYDEEGSAVYKCQYCDATFENAASLADHAKATFPVANHETVCSNHCDVDFDGEDDKCEFSTSYKVEMEEHQAECEYKDTMSNWEKAVAYFKAGNVAEGFKYLGKAIIDFVKSDTFKGIVNKVVDFVKGIDFGGIIGKVKDIIAKIPFAEIVSKIQGLVG